MASSSPFTGTLTASTLSTTTTSHLRSPLSSSSTTPRSSRITSDDDDQIVWNVSGGSNLTQLEGVMTSDEDFVVLAEPRSDLLTSVKDDPLEQKTPVSTTKRMETQMTSLSSKAAAKKAKKSKRSKKATASSAQDTTTKTSQQRNSKRSKKATASSVQDTTTKTSQQRNSKRSGESPKHADILLVPISRTNSQFIPAQVVSAFENLGLGQRPIVDDLSEQLSVISGGKTPTVYEEASTFISMFLSNPDAKTDDIYRLTLLQSLIIELGLGTSSALPPTLSAAKAFLKARAFLNIREYIAVRGQGPEAVRSVMYPTRSALIKSIKKKRNATSIKWVKELGLQVLLVGYLH